MHICKCVCVCVWERERERERERSTVLLRALCSLSSHVKFIASVSGRDRERERANLRCAQCSDGCNTACFFTFSRQSTPMIDSRFLKWKSLTSKKFTSRRARRKLELPSLQFCLILLLYLPHSEQRSWGTPPSFLPFGSAVQYSGQVSLEGTIHNPNVIFSNWLTNLF